MTERYVSCKVWYIAKGNSVSRFFWCVTCFPSLFAIFPTNVGSLLSTGAVPSGITLWVNSRLRPGWFFLLLHSTFTRPALLIPSSLLLFRLSMLSIPLVTPLCFWLLHQLQLCYSLLSLICGLGRFCAYGGCDSCGSCRGLSCWNLNFCVS